MKDDKIKIELSEKDFEFICPVQTKDMQVINGGYFCSECEKKVYDVSAYTQDEFDTLKNNHSGLCMNIKKIVTTTLILNSALCVASTSSLENSFGSKRENKLAPFSQLNLEQPIFLEHLKEVELGGGAVAPVYEFEYEEPFVPIEPFVIPPVQKDENRTEDGDLKV